MNLESLVLIALIECQDERSSTSQSTYRSHANKMLNYWGRDRDIRTITLAELKVWREVRLTSVKSNSLVSEKAFFSRVYRIAEEQGIDVVCPLPRLKIPPCDGHRDRLLEPDEMERIQAAVDPWDFSIIEGLRQTFMRRLEFFDLRRENVVLKKKEVVISPVTGNPVQLYLGKAKILTSKTGKGRTCPLNYTAAAIAHKWMTERPGPHVFGPQGEDRFAIACAWTARVWVPVCKRLGIVDAHLHDVRALGATTSYHNGAKVRQISLMLGHSSIKQTEVYLRTGEIDMWPAAFAVQLGMQDSRASLDEIPGWSESFRF